MEHNSDTENDRLWGFAEIAGHIKRKTHQARYLWRKRRIRVKQLGPKTFTATKSELDADMAAVDATPPKAKL